MNLDLREIPAVYINLQQDVEKKNSIVDVLDECGFENIIRIDGEYTPDRPLAGCSYSHYKALNEVEPPFIIFEDDCKAKNFRTIIDVPDDSDAVYLGISSWGRMNSHSGPCVQYEELNGGLLRIYNMLSAHSVLYLDEDYVSLCSKISHKHLILHNIKILVLLKYKDIIMSMHLMTLCFIKPVLMEQMSL